jgi:crossover junction endodeoxyribonuclease RusA
MGQWVIELPPQRAPSPNLRLDRFAQNAQTQAWRHAAKILCLEAKIPALERASVALLLTPNDRRDRDPDNIALAAKASIDGVVDAGVLADDNARYVHSVLLRITDPDRNLPSPLWRLVLTEVDAEGVPK